LQWTPTFYLHIASLIVSRFGAWGGDPFHIHSNGSGTMIKSISFFLCQECNDDLTMTPTEK
jgi:hypothetical protein